MKTLQLSKLDSNDHLITPDDFNTLSLKSPALDAFTDFKEFRPLVIEANTKAVDAQIFMERAHVDYKIVIDEMKEVLGMISLQDLSDQRLIKEVSHGLERNEITVSDLMVARSDVYAFDYEALAHAWVMDVVEALKRNGLKYCLVVDHKNHEIRGILSAKEIAQRLKISFDSNKPPTFAEVFSVIHH